VPNQPDLVTDPSSPVRDIRPGAEEIRPGVGLCLSGGGYRAMVFHVGVLWRLNEAGYLPKLPTALPCPFDRTTELADTPTRLARMDAERQERLINWGYAVCDAALRKHVAPAPASPAGFPYPRRGV